MRQSDVLTQWEWKPQPEASAFVNEIAATYLKLPDARAFAQRLYAEAGIRFVDLIDTIQLPSRSPLFERAQRVGWVPRGSHWRNHSGQFPRLESQDSDSIGIRLKVDRTSDSHAFRDRLRSFTTDEEGFAHAEDLIDQAIASVGRDRAAEEFFAAEREYWQGRNRAAQIQKARQDRLGIGWANHDHHTYRSSRVNFARMVALFEKFGFYCRERFYAGLAAGWGAQVLEQDETGIVLFCDVDLSPDELRGDFAHEGLAARSELGTIGLWCALHGDSVLQAGMHHLECTFDFDALEKQLSVKDVRMMKPFSSYPHLKQAFTEGERWPVDPMRIQRLVDQRALSPDQARQFQREGAIGSHLENLERNQGFKGFNQTGVNEIIRATDPRSVLGTSTG